MKPEHAVQDGRGRVISELARSTGRMLDAKAPCERCRHEIATCARTQYRSGAIHQQMLCRTCHLQLETNQLAASLRAARHFGVRR
jgi:hypothetical protein